jgi:DNA-binding transcriptional LysR family regulator
MAENSRRTTWRDIRPDRRPGRDDEVDQAFMTADVQPRLNLETPRAFVACALVAHAGGVSIVDEMTATSYGHPGLVVRQFRLRLYSDVWSLRPQILRRSGLADALQVDVEAEIQRLGYSPRTDEPIT